MNVQRFPCRWCHVLTASIDSYVICADCLQELDSQAHEDDLRSAPIDAATAVRLKKLLDEW